MKFSLPLDEMTTEEKLAAMELLWDDLRRPPGSVPSPAWHDEVLSEREKRVREGASKFSDLSEVKDRSGNPSDENPAS